MYMYIPSGGKPRQRFERFWKKCRFRHSETSVDELKFPWIFPGKIKGVLVIVL